MEQIIACMGYWNDCFRDHPCRIRCLSKLHNLDATVTLVFVFYEPIELPMTSNISLEEGVTTFYINLDKKKYNSPLQMTRRIDQVFSQNFVEIIKACSEKRPTLDFQDQPNSERYVKYFIYNNQ